MNSSKDCPSQSTIAAVLAGSLKSLEIERHLERCQRCAETIEGMIHGETAKAAARLDPGNVRKLSEAAKRFKLGSPKGLAESQEFATQVSKQNSQYSFLEAAQSSHEIGRLGDYRILRVLGQGGMGLVFEAEDSRLKRSIALKVMLPSIASEPTAKHRFLREAQCAAAVEHDNIITIHQVGEIRGIPFIAMPLLKGEPLSARLKRKGKLTQDEILKIGYQAANGLAAAHKNNLIHRDIKPENLWLESNTGRLKILDFGLVRGPVEERGVTQSGALLGTPKYMSPEQALGSKVDHKSDLFSLGSVLYRAISGEAPFEGTTIGATLFAVINAQPKPLIAHVPDLNEDLLVLVERLMSKRVEDRPANAAEVAQTLRSIHRSISGGHLEKSNVLLKPVEREATGAAASSDLTPNSYGWLPIYTRFTYAIIVLCALAACLLPVIVLNLRSPKNSQFERSVSVDEGSLQSSPQVLLDWYGWPVDAPQPAKVPFDDIAAQKFQRSWAEYLNVPEVYTNSIGMRFRLIPPGEFLMGSTDEEVKSMLEFAGGDYFWKERIQEERPRHRTVISKPFFIGETEVTQKHYRDITGKSPSFFSQTGGGAKEVHEANTESFPVESVCFNDFVEACSKLSISENLDPIYVRSGEMVTKQNGVGYRLPTEAEWEFACRGGTQTRYSTGDQDESVYQAGWVSHNSNKVAHQVAKLRANSFGLFDMHGNICEFVEDGWTEGWYDTFEDRVAIDPICLFKSLPTSQRIARGGYFSYRPAKSRSSDRDAHGPKYAASHLGYRLVLPVSAVQKLRRSSVLKQEGT